MQKNRAKSETAVPSEERRRQRIRLLGVLAGICRKIERLQSSDEARRACREVAASLRGLVAQEEGARLSRRN